MQRTTRDRDLRAAQRRVEVRDHLSQCPTLGTGVVAARAVNSDPVGGAHSALRLVRDPRLVGARLAVQFMWLGPLTPPPCPPLGVSASNALELTLQP